MAQEKMTLRANLADAPAAEAIKSGKVTSPIVALNFIGPKLAHDGFKGMMNEGKYDVGELAIVTYLQARQFGKPFVILPFPVSGRPQHHCAGFNSELHQYKPGDIEGKRVGVRSYAQTTGLWIRGVLQDEYGVNLSKVNFFTSEDGHHPEYKDPSNCTRLPDGSNLGQMLLDGELDVCLMGNDMPKDPKIRTLIPDAINAGNAWVEKKGFLPINHMFAVHQDISRKHPEMVKEIFRMLVESRAASTTKERLPPIGLEANRKCFEFAIETALDQKIISKRFSVDELFDDTTASLGA